MSPKFTHNGGAGVPPSQVSLFAMADDLIARLKASPPDQRKAVLDHINAALSGKKGRKQRLRSAGDYQNDPMFAFAVNYLGNKPSANRNEVAAAYARAPGAISLSEQGLYKRFSTFWSWAKRMAEQAIKARALLNELDAAAAAGAVTSDDEPLDEFFARIRRDAAT